jgi:hypothetical protein
LILMPGAHVSCCLCVTNFGGRQWRTQEFFSGEGGSTNSVEDGGQRVRGSGGGSPLVRICK